MQFSIVIKPGHTYVSEMPSVANYLNLIAEHIKQVSVSLDSTDNKLEIDFPEKDNIQNFNVIELAVICGILILILLAKVIKVVYAQKQKKIPRVPSTNINNGRHSSTSTNDRGRTRHPDKGTRLPNRAEGHHEQEDGHHRGKNGKRRYSL